MFFNRKKYKEFAKVQLKNRWTVPVLITLIVYLIGKIFSIPEFVSKIQNNDFMYYLHSGDISGFWSYLNTYFEGIPEAQKGTPLGLIIAELLVASILDMAAIGVYLKMSRSPEKVSLSLFFEGLNNWWKAVRACLWKLLWCYLWSLLFIIPGFVKMIAYSQMYFILNEHPNVGVTKSMKISLIITKGHKADLFALYLSFLGWILLALLTGGIGFLWLKPYMNMTCVNAYHALMKDALETGLLRPEDLA